MVGRRAVLTSAVALLLCGCGGKGSNASEPQIVLGQNTARGKGVAASASVGAQGRTQFSARVTATPNQRVSGGWVTACAEFHHTTREADNFSGRTPLTVRIRPIAPSTGKCTVIVTATIARSGRVKVELLSPR
jgi:hypothetical protein